jgi:hypothetical protein
LSAFVGESGPPGREWRWERGERGAGEGVEEGLLLGLFEGREETGREGDRVKEALEKVVVG